MDKFSELKAAAMAATPGPWGINRTGNTIVSNQSHPVATVSDAFHRQLAGGGVGKDAEFIAAANPAVVLELLAELEAKKQEHRVHAARLISERGVLRERIAELEAEITNIVDNHAETVAELRAKLATPIKIVNYDEFFICHVSGASDDYCKGWVDGRNAAARDVGKAGFTVEGDE
ncbi:TPA: ead/Ea22-like family protein [Serratia marcescens]